MREGCLEKNELLRGTRNCNTEWVHGHGGGFGVLVFSFPFLTFFFDVSFSSVFVTVFA